MMGYSIYKFISWLNGSIGLNKPVADSCLIYSKFSKDCTVSKYSISSKLILENFSLLNFILNKYSSFICAVDLSRL